MYPKAYQAMSKSEKWVADQTVQLVVRVVTDLAEQGADIYLSEEEIEDIAGKNAYSIQEGLINAVQSRALSIAYDFCFGKIDRNGKMVVSVDLIKQMFLAGLGEAINDHVKTT